MQPLWFIKTRAQYRVFVAHYPDYATALATVAGLGRKVEIIGPRKRLPRIKTRATTPS